MKKTIYSICFILGYLFIFKYLNRFFTKTTIYVLLIIISLLLFKKEILESIKKFKKIDFNDCLSAVIVVFIISLPLSLLLNQTITNNEKNNIYYLIFSSLIYAPLVEEIFNRVCINHIINKITKNKFIINITSSIIFSLMHIYKMKLNIQELIYYLIIYTLLGYICSYYYEKNNNFIKAYLIHLFWNGFMIMGMIIRILVWR